MAAGAGSPELTSSTLPTKQGERNRSKATNSQSGSRWLTSSGCTSCDLPPPTGAKSSSIWASRNHFSLPQPPTLSSGYVALSLKQRFEKSESDGELQISQIPQASICHRPVSFPTAYLSSFPITLDSQSSRLNLIVFTSLHHLSLSLFIPNFSFTCYNWRCVISELSQMPLLLLWLLLRQWWAVLSHADSIIS